jgi:16S rRNA processing protein RimM
MPHPNPVLIAEIGAAHGVRGEVRVKAHTAEPGAIADYGPLQDEHGRIFKVRTMRPLKDDMLVVAFAGIADRNAAEALTRTKLFVDRRSLPQPEAEEFYYTDLIGLAVVTEAGDAIGRIAAVQNFGADDLLEVSRPGRASVYVPFTHAVVPTVDVAGGQVVITPPDGLLDDDARPPQGGEG